MPAESSNTCKSCRHANQKSFNAEIAMHFSGLDGLDKPIVWVFPKCSVCLSCGCAEFLVPERELRVLAEGKRVDGALVLHGKLPAHSAEAA